MNLSVIGLGQTGQGVAKRLLRGGHKVVAYDHDAAAISVAAHENAIPAGSLADVVAKLTPPRIFWLALAAGPPTESVVTQLIELAVPGDLIVDGGKGFFKDAIRRDALCRSRALHYVDVGLVWSTSGRGAVRCLMVGGEARIVRRLSPILNTLMAFVEPEVQSRRRRSVSTHAGDRSYVHAGTVGAGHFAMMVQSGIEASIAQAYWEGLVLIRLMNAASSPEGERCALNAHEIARAWGGDFGGIASPGGDKAAGTSTEPATASMLDDCRDVLKTARDLGAPVAMVSAALSSAPRREH